MQVHKPSKFVFFLTSFLIFFQVFPAYSMLPANGGDEKTQVVHASSSASSSVTLTSERELEKYTDLGKRILAQLSLQKDEGLLDFLGKVYSLSKLKYFLNASAPNGFTHQQKEEDERLDLELQKAHAEFQLHVATQQALFECNVGSEAQDAVESRDSDAVSISTVTFHEAAAEQEVDLEQNGASVEAAAQQNSCWSRWKKAATAFCAGALTATCITASSLVQNDWVAAGFLVSGAAILYATGAIASPLTPTPSSMSSNGELAVKALVGGTFAFAGNFLSFKTVKMAMAPGSNLNLVALQSLTGLIVTTGTTVGSLVFFNQPPNWPTFVGLVAAASVTGLQIWYAIQHPVSP